VFVSNRHARQRPSYLRGIEVDLSSLKNVEQRLLREYLDLPGLSLSPAQTARLLGVDPSTCQLVLNDLVDAQYLAYGESGMYVRGARDGDLELWKTLVRNRLAVLAQTPFPSPTKTRSGRGRPQTTDHRFTESV
jgi:hypothetical protein